MKPMIEYLTPTGKMEIPPLSEGASGSRSHHDKVNQEIVTAHRATPVLSADMGRFFISGFRLDDRLVSYQAATNRSRHASG
jgi:hypothetical protein